MRLGIDMDGVLVDFNSQFIERCIEVTGRDLFPPRPFDIPTWNYPEYYGYTYEEISAVWDAIKRDPHFWATLGTYPTTERDLTFLDWRKQIGDDVYFITNRMGIAPKAQTERWLERETFKHRHTVLVSAEKGLCAQALKLDVYIDDKWENCVDVVVKSPGTTVYLMDRSWNRNNTNARINRTNRVEGIV